MNAPTSTNPNDQESIVDALAALKRAKRRAEDLRIATGTELVEADADGGVVLLSPVEINARRARRGGKVVELARRARRGGKVVEPAAEHVAWCAPSLNRATVPPAAERTGSGSCWSAVSIVDFWHDS